ncbi:30S ribosome-binding factor RbfA [Thioalkalicoccus limnaeus]|uniref:Ribosome-binding factor A n=1 Tax=Thioalkalicoccus limnaeus TaxID=120681 RepID=A0ABV4BG61_9GAMM
MKEFDRTARIGAEMQRELALILRAEVRDPRLGDITVQEVRVSRDLGHAKIFFTCFPLDDGGHEQARLLNSRLAGFLRRELGHRLRLRTIPELHFVHDETVRRGERLSSLIDEAVATQRPDPEQQP